MEKAFKPRTLLWIAAILQIVWGLVPSASQFVIDEIPVELYIAIRWSISGFIFFAYLAISRRWKMPAPRDTAKIALLGVLGYAVGSLGFLYGLKLGGVANFAIMNALGPVITSFTAFIVLHEKPKPIFYAALPICVAGLILLVVGRTEISNAKLARSTAVILMAAATLEALTFTFSKRLRSRVGIIEYLAIAQIAAASFMWILQIAFFHQIGSVSHLTPRGLMSAIFVSVIACVFCYAILYWLLKYIDGHKLALFDGVHALSATAFGILIFHEKLNTWMILGGILLILGLVLGTGFFDRKQKETQLTLVESE